MMDGIIIAIISVVVIVMSTYLIIKGARNHTSHEIKTLEKQIHEGIGKIDLLSEQFTFKTGKPNDKKQHTS